eukprot:COSAG05_NODE_50_length_24118_cov_89.534036_10_plen_101_part_00
MAPPHCLLNLDTWVTDYQCLGGHAQVVETSRVDEDAQGEAIDSSVLTREFSVATMINSGLMGGVMRHREFVCFHGERVYPEYLLAYRRGSKLASVTEDDT